MRINPGRFRVFIPLDEIMPRDEKTHDPVAKAITTSDKKTWMMCVKAWLKKPTMPKIPTLTYGGFLALLVTSCLLHVSTFFEYFALRTALTSVGFTLFSTTTSVKAQGSQPQEQPKANPTDPKPPETPATAPSDTPSANAAPLKSQQNQPASPENATQFMDSGTSPSPQGTTKEPSLQNDAMFDLMGLTESQLKVLLSLSTRLKEVEAREQKVMDEQQLLQAVRKEMQERQAQLTELKRTIEEVSKNNNDDVMKNMTHMVAVYEAMKPDIAAKIFNELPKPVLVALIKQMKPKKASAILSLMRVDIAKAITDHFAFAPYVPDEKGGKKA